MLSSDHFKDFKFSFEVFPPKKEDDFPGIYDTLSDIAALDPRFISVTYGAGGSRPNETIRLAAYIQNELKTEALAHLTCVGYMANSLISICEQLAQSGVRNILALRGDRPVWMDDVQFNGREFEHASDMTSFIKTRHDFFIAGAAYPEKHFEAEDFHSDLAALKLKCDAGARLLITQLFFDNDAFYRFEEMMKKADIHCPVIPGILPITSAKQLGTTISLSGSAVPKALSDLIAKYGERSEDMKKAGIDYAVKQAGALKAHGACGVHIYTMNKAAVASEIVRAVG